MIGSEKYPFDEKTGKILAPDMGPKGDSILKDGKWIPIVEALRGTLIRKGTKLAYKLATKKKYSLKISVSLLQEKTSLNFSKFFLSTQIFV